MEINPQDTAEAQVFLLRFLRDSLNERAKKLTQILRDDLDAIGILAESDRLRIRQEVKACEVLYNALLSDEMALQNGRGNG